ncbi:gfo/Idh/MocA family oxidoreductase [Maribellus comscasis]|uniref:Gfo/Idh/MocA family oxidoreductase n=1 Tax=Maribellus comscasis TaxID=2681766 RepID=A0A6I6JSJ4_9BACT|nr:Gfo/Idh/MocA family oxidoreductase [Maribellus comscasis]QGY44070.1 gfo/Idh/MocA family oxidoreductase [Maribellus comscasis]
MKTYRIAILGCGKVAHLHAKAVQNLKNAKLAGVWSRSKNTAEKFASEYKVPFYSEIEPLIKNEKIDLTIICTPHPFHLEPAKLAAKAGSHILVEKPLASTLEDSDEMIKTCKNAGVKLGVISQRRWYEPVKRVKDAIDAGKLGKPVFGTINMLGWRDEAYYEADEWRGTWKMEGGGVLVNQAPHQLDILLWYMGEIDEVYGLWRNLNHPYIEVEDTAVAIIKFKNGGIGNIIVSNSQKPGIYGKVHVHGENGASAGVQTDGGAMFIAGMSGIQEPPVNDIWSVPGEEKLMEKWKSEDSAFFNSVDPTIYYMERQIEDFIQAIENKREPLVTGEDGRRTVELFTAIYRSTRDNKPVKFPLHPEGEDDLDGRLKK